MISAQDFDLDALPRQQKSRLLLQVAPRDAEQWWYWPLLAITGSEPGPVLVVSAGVHGNEYAGIATIPQIYQRLDADELRGTLVMLPVLNPPAYEAATRSSPVDGLNLARVFPGKADGTLSQRFAHAFTEGFLRHADFYIDLHTGGPHHLIPPLIGYIKSDDTVGRQSAAAADAFGASVIWAHPAPVPPGRTISAALDLGVPCLYTEAPDTVEARAAAIQLYGDGVLNVMAHLGMLADDIPGPQPLTHRLLGDGNLDVVLNAPVGGYFTPAVRLLDAVVEGQNLGTIRDLFGDVIGEIKAPRDGVVIMLTGLPRVQIGEGIAQITGQDV